MFYKQFLKITDVLDERFVKEFDFWLATLSQRDSKTISVSTVASRFELKYAVAEVMIKFAESEGILRKRYIVTCPNEECDFFYRDFDADELLDVLGTIGYCHNCGNEFTISYENTLIVYSKEKEPNIPEDVLRKEIEKCIKRSEDSANFFQADLLLNSPNEIYELYYHPGESAYQQMAQMKSALDGPFRTTTEKGDALEKLSLFLFNQIKAVSGTNEIKTYTNQFDCTIRFPQTSKIFPTIMKYMTPYFIIECKNEAEQSGKGKTPSNTYYHKLSDIMSSNDAQLGIVISRGSASVEDILISYQNYLLCRNSNKQKIMLSLSDDDLTPLIDKRVNLLEYLGYKMDVLTMNARNATFDMFRENKQKYLY